MRTFTIYPHFCIFPAVTRKELFDILKAKGYIQPLRSQSLRILTEYVVNKLNMYSCKKYVENIVLTFCSDLNKKWKACGRNSNRLSNKHTLWLGEKLKIETNKMTAKEETTPTTSRGRPQKTFEDGSKKTKKRKVQHLVKSHSPSELTFATCLSLQASGRRDAATVVKEATETSPTRATKIKKAFWSAPENIKPFTPEEALGMIVDLKLSKYQYTSLRQLTKDKGIDIYPSYEAIKKAKGECYPEENGIIIKDTSAEIKLQSLLDCTATRLVKLQEDVLSVSNSEMLLENVEILYKWGFDGSSGQRQYKQRFSEETSTNISDSNLLITSLVPIQMYGFQGSKKAIIWHNPRMSSTRYCRPIRFQLKKETKETIKEEVEYIQTQIDSLRPTRVIVNTVVFTIKHKLLLTMVDGKVCSSITETSSQICYICGASPKDMNKLEAV